MTGKHNAEKIYKFKSWGPPNNYWKKTFTGGESEPTKIVNNDLEPEKKTA